VSKRTLDFDIPCITGLFILVAPISYGERGEAGCKFMRNFA
jgi:hypothetical protein